MIGQSLVGIASIANIGSAPSAAMVGAAYGRNLVPLAVMMALIGSMPGSFVGLRSAKYCCGYPEIPVSMPTFSAILCKSFPLERINF